VAPACFVPSEDGRLVLTAAEAAARPSAAPVLAGSNSNEGFLRLMEFLTRLHILHLLGPDGCPPD
jgi:hypothetical protein